ncbi:L-sorbosone dehydrogenase [Fusarium bulbicola]|nr:L-sorbosone dehydrogenase [Fusarium bulbicola]
MTSLRIVAVITLISTLIASFTSAQQCSYEQLKPRRSKPNAAAGWEYSVVDNSFRQPRTILFDTEGALLVLDSITGIIHLKLDDSDKGGRCVRLEKKTTLLKKSSLNHGLALSKDGRTMYASSSNSVWSYSYDPKIPMLNQSSEQLVVENMANDGHTWRSLLMSQKHPELLIVSRGSGLGGDPQAETIVSGHAQIRVFNISAFESKAPDGPVVKPHDFHHNGARLGWGLRNALGLTEHPGTGGIFSTENSYEILHRDGKDISVDNPGDELNFHGTLNGSGKSTGSNYGYPFCYSVWSIEKFPRRSNVRIGEHFGADRGSQHSRRTDVECVRDYTAPVQVFQAQSAPIGLEFHPDGTRAYLAFHGSWNRFEPVGYEVGYIDFKKGQPALAAIQSRTAVKHILSNHNMARCGEDCFRPVSLALDKKNRLFFSSDSTREIFVLYDNSTTP